jgi:fatty-acyl-CoA synthase
VTHAVEDSVRSSIASQTVADLIRRSASRDPDATAVVFRDERWSYGELVAQAGALSRGLRDLGVQPDDRVAFLGFNSARYIIGWLGTHLAGAVHVPINYMLGPSEVAYVLKHSGATVCFADESLAPVLDAAVDQAALRVARCALEGATTPDGYRSFDSLLMAGDDLPSVRRSGDVAQIAYTSGTESSPKGAMLSHEALISQYTSCIVAGQYEASDRVINGLPLYHCAQLHCFLMPYLWLGATNIVLSKADPGELMDAVERLGVTSIFAPPTVWIGILRHPDFDPARLASLTKGYYGASIMPVEVVRELNEKLPTLALWNYYGQTEMCPLATVLLPHEQLTRPGSAGRPVLNVETLVVDDAMQPVAPGQVGEVVHRSPQVMLRYYNDEAKTADAFSGGWFHSGDLATQDADGYITIVDRKKDMINSGGENVSSREVEEILYEHPDVAEVAVVGVPDEKWIEAVCAVVVRRAGTSPTEDDLIAFTRDRLARFKVPKQVVFIEALPKNPSGKILKRELRESLAPGSPA